MGILATNGQHAKRHRAGEVEHARRGTSGAASRCFEVSEGGLNGKLNRGRINGLRLERRPKPGNDQIGTGVVVVLADDLRHARDAAISGNGGQGQQDGKGKEKGFHGVGRGQGAFSL